MKITSKLCLKPAMILVGLAPVLVAGWSMASPLTESFTVNYASAISPISLPSGGTNTDVLALPQFNPALGTLQSVKLTLSSEDTANVVLYNLNSTAVTYTSASAYFPTILVTTTIPGLSTSESLTTSYGAGSAAGGSPFALTTLPGTAELSQQTVTLSSGLSAYEGTGTEAVTVGVPAENGTYSLAGASKGGVLFVGGNASTYGNITVQYSYTATPAPTPEPTTLGLGAAAGVVGWLFRRRSAQK